MTLKLKPQTDTGIQHRSSSLQRCRFPSQQGTSRTRTNRRQQDRSGLIAFIRFRCMDNPPYQHHHQLHHLSLNQPRRSRAPLASLDTVVIPSTSIIWYRRPHNPTPIDPQTPHPYGKWTIPFVYNAIQFSQVHSNQITRSVNPINHHDTAHVA